MFFYLLLEKLKVYEYCLLVWILENISLKKKDFIYVFSERGEEGEKEGEKHRSGASRTHPGPGLTPQSAAGCALMENGAGDLPLCGTLADQLSHSGQAFVTFSKLGNTHFISFFKYEAFFIEIIDIHHYISFTCTTWFSRECILKQWFLKRSTQTDTISIT